MCMQLGREGRGVNAKGILEIAKAIGHVEFLPGYKIFTKEAVKDYMFQSPFVFVAESVNEEMAIWVIEELNKTTGQGKINTENNGLRRLV